MKFRCNTKPLNDALNLCVIRANVSNFYKKSCIIQVSVDGNQLILNTEADNVYTEVRLPGEIIDGSPEAVTVFVSSLQLQQLVNTFDVLTTELEFNGSGLILYSGTSRFTLPKLVDGDELSLTAPKLPETNTTEIPIDQDVWKFIEDKQMYALAMSFSYPVYTKVWVGTTNSASTSDLSDTGMNPPTGTANQGDVLVSDFTRGLSTHSTGVTLGRNCLLTDTIVSLFTSLPEGAKLIHSASSNEYVIRVTTDSFEYMSQFTPLYEDDESVGDYNADVILGTLEHSDKNIQISIPAITKFLNQASLLSSSSEDKIFWAVKDGTLTLHDANVNTTIPVDPASTDTREYSEYFRTELLDKVLSKYSGDKVTVAPYYRQDELIGLVFWDSKLTTVLTSVDEGG